MIKNLDLILGLTVFGLLSSCSSMYIPPATSIPLLESKGESQIDLSASTNSIHLAGDFAFTKKYALMISGNLSYGNFSNHYDIFTHKDDYSESAWDLKEYGEFAHKYAEIGIGRYNILEQVLKLELFGGVGFGNASDNILGYTNGDKDYKAKYTLIFLQTNIGKTLGKVDFGWALRVAFSFYDYSYRVDPAFNYPNNDNEQSQNSNFTMIHLEPGGFVRFGNERIKFVCRLGLSLSKNLTSLEDLDLEKGISGGDINTTGLHISIGINYNFRLSK
jgi:hypothetical protein